MAPAGHADQLRKYLHGRDCRQQRRGECFAKRDSGLRQAPSVIGTRTSRLTGGALYYGIPAAPAIPIRLRPTLRSTAAPLSATTAIRNLTGQSTSRPPARSRVPGPAKRLPERPVERNGDLESHRRRRYAGKREPTSPTTPIPILAFSPPPAPAAGTSSLSSAGPPPCSMRLSIWLVRPPTRLGCRTAAAL